jgi:hypothetical protein
MLNVDLDVNCQYCGRSLRVQYSNLKFAPFAHGIDCVEFLCCSNQSLEISWLDWDLFRPCCSRHVSMVFLLVFQTLPHFTASIP